MVVRRCECCFVVPAGGSDLAMVALIVGTWAKLTRWMLVVTALLVEEEVKEMRLAGLAGQGS